MKKIIFILIFLLIPISFGEVEEDTILVLLEDGTLETRVISEFLPEMFMMQTTKITGSLVDEAVAIAKQTKGVAKATKVQPLYLEDTLPIDINALDSWRFDFIKMTEMWDDIADDTYVDYSDIVVCVMDTGININHPDMNIDTDNDKDFAEDDDDATDYNGHGTHVSGTIGAIRDSGADDVVGIAPGVTILPYKVFPDGPGGSSDDLAKALKYIVDNNIDVDIINMSLSYGQSDSIINGYLETLEQRGIVIIAAASNDSNLWIENETFDSPATWRSDTIRSYKTISEPAAQTSVMAIGSVAHSAGEIGISDFSNITSLIDSDEKIDVVAPGSGIMSSYYLDFDSAVGMSGTSMATPHVSGFAALLVAKYPDLTAEEIKTVIRETAYEPLFNIDGTDTPNITTPSAYSHDAMVGSGLINVEAGMNFSTIHNIDFSEGTLAFDRDTLAYTLNVSAETTSVDLSASIMTGASAELDGGALIIDNQSITESITLSEDINIINLVGRIGTYENKYTISINKPAVDNAYLSVINSSLGDLDQVFDKDTLIYSITVPYSKNTVTLMPGLSDSSASITIDGEVMTSKTYTVTDDVTVSIVVTAVDTTTTKTYEVTFSRAAPATDATLSDIAVMNDNLEEVFNSSTTAYTIVVPYTNSGITMTPVLSDTNASFSIDGNAIESKDYEVNENFVVTILVTAEDGVTTTAYTIEVTREAPSTDAKLSAIDITNEALEEAFLVSTTTYTLIVPYTNDDITITPSLNDSNASFTINGENVLSKTYGVIEDFIVTIVVTAEDGITSETYTINVTREAPSTDATLSNLATSVYPITNFASETLEYTLTIPKEAVEFIVSPLPSDPNAGFTIDGNSELTASYTVTSDQDIEIVVTAEDNTTTKTYIIHVIVEKSSNADLTSITLDKYNLEEVFDKDIVNYTMLVPYPSERFTITVSLSNDLASATIDGDASETKEYTITENHDIEIIVTAEDLTTKTYTIQITERPLSDVNTLRGLSIDGSSISGFVSNQLSYDIDVTYSTTSVDIVALPTDDNASATINVNNPITLSIGINEIDVVVTAEDGIAKETYTIRITRQAPSTDASLSDLTVDGSMIPGFLHNQLSYDIDVANNKSSVEIVAIKTDSNASVIMSELSPVSLTVGLNMIEIVVTAEDGSTTQTYTLNITREEADNSGGSPPVVTPPVVTPPVVIIPPVVIPPVEAEDTVETVEDEDGQETTVVEVSEERVVGLVEDDTVEIIEIIADQTESASVTLGSDVLDALRNTDKPLEIQFEAVTFQMDQEILSGLNLKGTLNITCEPTINTTEDMNVVSEVFELDLHDDDNKISEINKAIPIVLDYDRAKIVNTSNLAIYYLEEASGQWVYVGGKILTGNKISFEARHFSKYAIRENYKTFDDIRSHWGRSYVETIASREITSGVSETEFAPDKTLTIAEFVVLVTKVLGLPEYEGSIPYVNVMEGDWYEPFFRKAYGAGLITNSFSVMLDPNKPILREEMASVLIATYTYYSGVDIGEIMTTEEIKAIDMDDVSSHFKRYVTYTYQLGLIEGDDMNRFNPQNGATRAEAAVVIKKLLILLDLL